MNFRKASLAIVIAVVSISRASSNGTVLRRRALTSICLPVSSCLPEQPLCRSCLPGDANCTEPNDLVEGFCGPYKDYTQDAEINRRQRYKSCKDAAVARALPEDREWMSHIKHRFFYKNCIKGEIMCGDGSCQIDESACATRGGVGFLAAGESECTAMATGDMIVPYDGNTSNISNDSEDSENSTDDPIRIVNGVPETLSTNDLVKFCTYFYEVVILGGRKQSKATNFYVEFLYSCFNDYQDFGAEAMVNAMNYFHELAGQRAVRNLQTFDARNYPGIVALP